MTDTTTTTPDVTVQLSPRARAVLRIKSLIVLLLVAPLLFVISLIGYVTATISANTTYLAYDAAEYDTAAYDRLGAEWQSAVDAAQAWGMFYETALPLLMITLLALVIVETATKVRAPR